MKYGGLKIPEIIDGYTITGIGDNVFKGCSEFTGTLTIPESVTSIGYSAFEGCRGFIGKLEISESIESIGTSAFSGCSGITYIVNRSEAAIKLPEVTDKIWRNKETGEEITSVTKGKAKLRSA